MKALLASRLRPLLAWLEEQIDQRNTTAGCLVVALIALPIALVLCTMNVWALLDPAAGRFYRPGLLRWALLQDGLGVLIYSGIALYCLPRYRSRRPRPWLAYGVTTIILAASADLAILYGHKDTPLALVFLASFALTRMWFPLRVLLPGLAISVALFVTAEILIRQGRLPYAPLLAHPVETGGELGWWWSIWMRVLYDMPVAFFAGLLFFMFALMDRRTRALEELTRIDTLTGLLNRATFMRLLEEECRKQGRSRRPLCVMMCDVDHFKKVNDSHGHAAGDAVLVRVGMLLRDNVRGPVDVPARFGGEEFAVLLPETALPAARRVAERIAAQLRDQVFESGGRRFSVTVSIGIAETRDGDGDKALRVADANLYEAKRAGRDRVVGSVAA